MNFHDTVLTAPELPVVVSRGWLDRYHGPLLMRGWPRRRVACSRTKWRCSGHRARAAAGALVLWCGIIHFGYAEMALTTCSSNTTPVLWKPVARLLYTWMYLPNLMSHKSHNGGVSSAAPCKITLTIKLSDGMEKTCSASVIVYCLLITNTDPIHHTIQH
jgi:hypothetical protein